MARASGLLCGVRGADSWGRLSPSLGYTGDAPCPGTLAPQPGRYKLLRLCFNLPTGFV